MLKLQRDYCMEDGDRHRKMGTKEFLVGLENLVLTTSPPRFTSCPQLCSQLRSTRENGGNTDPSFVPPEILGFKEAYHKQKCGFFVPAPASVVPWFEIDCIPQTWESLCGRTETAKRDRADRGAPLQSTPPCEILSWFDRHDHQELVPVLCFVPISRIRPTKKGYLCIEAVRKMPHICDVLRQQLFASPMHLMLQQTERLRIDDKEHGKHGQQISTKDGFRSSRMVFN